MPMGVARELRTSQRARARADGRRKVWRMETRALGH